MGLQQEIGYIARRPNAVQRTLQRLVSMPVLSPVLTKLVTPIDRTIHRMTSGRASVTSGVIAMPTVLLTTIGARSGTTRTAPLAAIPCGDDLALIASNAGSGKVPGWAYNLRANPAATVSYEERVVDVIAREAEGSEYEKIFEAADRIYAGYVGYRERADYVIPVFVLSSAGGNHE